MLYKPTFCHQASNSLDWSRSLKWRRHVLFYILLGKWGIDATIYCSLFVQFLSAWKWMSTFILWHGLISGAASVNSLSSIRNSSPAFFKDIQSSQSLDISVFSSVLCQDRFTLLQYRWGSSLVHFYTDSVCRITVMMKNEAVVNQTLSRWFCNICWYFSAFIIQKHKWCFSFDRLLLSKYLKIL